MFTIGDFARHGRVSVRMLRHYDAVGLLRPARVDPHSGYRFYGAGQLARLNRVIALKDLGFTLDQVRSILDEEVGPEELRGMLRLRQAELESAVSEAAARLARVAARLRAIESEGHMSTQDVVVKSVPAARLAELTGVAAGFGPGEIGPVITPLYQELCARLEAAGVTASGPGIAYYEDAPEGDGSIVVHAGMTVPAGVVDVPGVRIVDLPGLERAATVVHRGAMEELLPTIQTLATWVDANGYRSVGYSRELYLEWSEDPADWVTELQEPVEPVEQAAPVE
ncbi:MULTISPECIES: MerR family transcriptional regulator [Streptomyces]|uniref:MerR family transcriptional regulator n=2 Tax=Streptomyces TaxID=1883 RepID=A0A100Y2R6_9ACTN|nr:MULTISPECIES: MerR family transcriptional regulator [Streptomyces]KUH36634.1 MerR family transcriptional regulator [Streptomyces kanasensis]UUS32642.1 MerR family transcriptional regulator [Streptomyces changanensis]